MSTTHPEPGSAAQTPGGFRPSFPASELIALQTDEADGRSARARIAAGESPFRVHAAKVLGCYSTAQRLQALVLNLYNGDYWRKKVPCPLDDLFAGADEQHVQAALDMLRGYADKGENDPDFLSLGKRLAMDRLPRSRRQA